MNEKIFIDINGTKQGMFLQSENIENPVMLFLHGGPGSPETAFNQLYPTRLDVLFTVCWWEQRGAGISYNREITSEEMTMEQMISDTITVTNYLRDRFRKDKIYIMGHSWGSLLGVLTVQQKPELFHAYIGVGQVVQQDRSERLAYDYMINEFKKLNKKGMLRQLRKYPIDQGAPICMEYLKVRSLGMNKLGIGIMHKTDSMLDFAFIVLGFKGYTMKEKINFLRGNNFSLKCLWDHVLQIDLKKQAPSLQVPVYIFHGVYDYQVSYVVAKEYLTSLTAPIKGFYSFTSSAHSPCFEESEKMWNILCVDVLNNEVGLADEL